MKKISVFLVVLFLTGCGSTTYHGLKAGEGQAGFSRDWVECQGVSKSVSGYANDRIAYSCMQGKGWNMSTKKGWIF